MTTNRDSVSRELRSALAQFDQSELGSLFDFFDDTLFWIKDDRGRYLRVNRAFQVVFSLPSTKAVLGLTDFDLSPPWIAEAFISDDKRVLQGQRIVNRIELINGFDRILRWYCTQKIPLRTKRGVIGATAGMAKLLPDLQAPAFPVPELAPALAALQDETYIDLTNADLARLVGLSVSAFERNFQKHFQSSPMQFHRKLRLARVAAALVQTKNTIAEIAIRFGFSDQSHLTRQFKSVYGSTPNEWRTFHTAKRSD